MLLVENLLMSGGGPTDPYFENVALLLHGDGTNGGQNNTFIDSSSNNFTITRNGNTTQGSFNPYGTLWSNYFDGTGDYLQWTGTALGSGDFTVECWVNFQILSSNRAVIGSASSNTTAGWEIYTEVDKFRFYSGNTNVISSTQVLTVGRWYHVAAVRSGSTLKLYIDGVETGSATFTNNLTNTTFYVSYDSFGQAHNAYISNVRHVVGTAVYTAAFTPPASPLTAISGTSVLTCQSNRFIDKSSNAYAITRNGDTRVTSFAPFAPPTVYTSAVGGSAYIDGSADALSSPATATFAYGTGDFTWETWIYPESTPNDSYIICQPSVSSGGSDFPLLVIYNNTLMWLPSGAGNQSFGLPVTNGQWNHIAVVRQSGTMYGFLNGVRGSTTHSYTTSFGAERRIRVCPEINNQYRGYLSDTRISNVAVYTTTTYTIPTSKVAATSSTNLLLNYTNAAIFDSAAKNDLETVGNAQIDTTTKKFGTGSLEFDGTGDYVVQPTSNSYGYGTGDFTIEFWLYMTSVSGSQTIVSNLTSSSSTNPHLYINGTIRYYTAGADRITGASLSTGQWYHIALVRASGSTRLYIDGTQSGSTYTDSNDYGATAPLGIGTYWASGSPVTTLTLNGYIDDLRITKGVARYTANFTPPTRAFPDK